jgi:hypothetical protein
VAVCDIRTNGDRTRSARRPESAHDRVIESGIVYGF